MESPASYYLRIDIDDVSDGNPEDLAPPLEALASGLELTFVDLHTRLRTPHSTGSSQTEILTNAVQDHLHLCVRTDLLLFRWPWIGGPEDDQHVDLIETWIERLISDTSGEPVLGSSICVGVIQHRVAREPILRWGRGEPTDVEGVLCSARAVEIEALLRRRNAIWTPQDYHYRLPSGEHTDTFIRVADAIHEPQDAYAIACWISSRIEDGVGVVVDTGGLTPVVIQLEALLSRFDSTIGPTAILAAYPSGRPTIRRTVENARSDLTPRVLAIISVTSTGTLQNTLLDELDRAAESDGIDYTLDLIVDRVATNQQLRQFAPDGTVKSVSWFNLPKTVGTDSSGSCQHCSSPDKAPVVAVDPRTYGAMTLPRPHLVMPDVGYAEAGHLFWERAAMSGGRAIEVNPHRETKAARGKRVALPVRPIFERIAQPDGLEQLVRERWQCLLDDPQNDHDLAQVLERTALVVTSSHGIDPISSPEKQPDLNREESVRQILRGVGVDDGVPILSVNDKESFSQELDCLDRDDSVLLFSWGSVTGLTMRNAKLAIADALRERAIDRTVNGLVFHARSSAPGEWTAQQNQFRPGILQSLWASCFPWHSPLQNESLFLDRSAIDTASLSSYAANFLRLRNQFLGLYATYADQEDDWSPRFAQPSDRPHPEHVFWGMSRFDIHQKQVRGRSLYGKDLDCLTAYAAMGSVINYTRLNEQPRAAPRWVMFDLGRIVRSYFDAVIICSVIRWLQPGELWWAERGEPESIRESVAFLLDQSTDLNEQVLLVPELLLASAQGKVPTCAKSIVRDRAIAMKDAWPDDPTFDLARGAVEIGLELLDGC